VEDHQEPAMPRFNFTRREFVRSAAVAAAGAALPCGFAAHRARAGESKANALQPESLRRL
jgi:hypothetical protein